jgi:uncharacterized protein YbjT (DUF2867 family)
MILITGAAGKTGKAVLQSLAEKGMPVRAAVFRVEQVPLVEMLGAKEVVVGDLRDTKFMRRTVTGVNAIYHICPNVHPDEIAIGREIIAAAVALGIDHFVYHSVLHPQVEDMPHHWKKMRVEELLFKSGLAFTILQPAVYMQNLLGNWAKILETGKYTVPYAVETRLSMVDLDDVAEAAVIVLSAVSSDGPQPQHNGAIYELVGTPATSQTEVAEILSRQLRRTVIAESVSMDAWEREARAAGLGEYAVQTLLRMFAYYENYGFWGNSQALSWLLNRPATSLDVFVQREDEKLAQLAR